MNVIDFISATRKSFWIHLGIDAVSLGLGVTLHSLTTVLIVLTTWLSIECIQLQILLAERQMQHHEAIKAHIDKKIKEVQ